MNPDIDRVNLNQSSLHKCSTDRKVIEAGKRFLSIFVSSLKTAQIYDPNNEVFLEHTQELNDTLSDIFRMEGEAAVEVAADHLFFNGLRLPVDFASYSGYHFLMDRFIESEVGKVWFEDSFRENEFKTFLAVFSKSLSDSSKTFEDIEKELRTQGVINIHIQKPQKGRENFMKISSIRKVGKQMYSKSITLLKNMMNDAGPQQRIQAKVVHRLVQTIVDSVIDDEAYMLALTNIKNHYDYTLNHSVNVCVLSTALGYRLGIERKRLADLGIAALFHDIGKVNVPKEILTKPYGLTEEEYEVLKKHPYQGAEMLTHIKGLGRLPIRAIVVALEHHMGVDLSGYPRLSKKRHINLFSKIIAIADVFDAMTTSRAYRKKPYKRDEVLAEMMKESGKKFDPLLLKAFTSMLGLYPIGAVVLLNTGELAIVLETNQDPSHLDSPKVKLITEKSGRKIDGPIIDLASPDGSPDGWKRTIVKSVDAHKYQIDVASYL